MASIPSPPSTVKTRLLLISDTHNTFPIVQPPFYDSAQRIPLPKVDILLHAGDISMIGRIAEYKQVIAGLASTEAELKLVIAGNHDITLDKPFYERRKTAMHGSSLEDPDEARALWTSPETRAKGIVYLEEGTHSFALSNGAQFTIYASPYQPEFYDWAFAYKKPHDRFNPAGPPPSFAPDPIASAFHAPNPIPSHPQIDIMMTHGPPFQVLDHTRRGQPVGCPHLLRAAARVRPRLYVFGHIHEGWGAVRAGWESQPTSSTLFSSFVNIENPEAEYIAEKPAEIDVSDQAERPLGFGKETLFVNASIMNVHYQPVQAPWLVEMELPRAPDESQDEVYTSNGN
ncbi:MAG: hypothetical protein M1814_006925 [Vezdaea aestivalis]|nr:MAG: hypothetical protein M1814_006925 [Vezdaea aestivalis]